MTKNVFDRLRTYYQAVINVLRGEAEAASIFPNTSDIGLTREMAYVKFLTQHAPSKCNVRLGGFLFDEHGTESKQLDIIITTDTTPKFEFNGANGKSFSPVEGTLAIVSVKSMLNKNELFDALSGIASIPPTQPLGGRVNQMFQLSFYDDWPLKIIYASNGIAHQTLLTHLNDYYRDNPQIPLNRRPNLIHVVGNCFIMRSRQGMKYFDINTGMHSDVPEGEFRLVITDSDLQAIVWTLHELQQNASASTHILFSYNFLMTQTLKVPI